MKVSREGLVRFDELLKVSEQVLEDGNVCSGKHFNYYKLFQHALSYWQTNSRSKLLNRTIDQPVVVTRLRYLMRGILRGKLKPQLKQTVLLNDGRSIDTPQGKRSYYFHNIVKQLSLEDISVIPDSVNPSEFEMSIKPERLALLANGTLDSTCIGVLRDLREVSSRFRSEHSELSELHPYINSVFSNFFEDFVRYHNLFKRNKVKHLMLTCHYHREGLIAAAKMHGITVSEFQHGLISPHDLYYVYPKKLASIASRALFPDKLHVFGKYWRNILLQGGEYTPDQVIVTGDYSLQSTGRDTYKTIEKKDVIFIGTQKNLPDYYTAFTEQLVEIIAKENPGWEIWVKLHPLEKEPKKYDALLKHSNCKVFGKTSELMPLLCASKIQVSIYSTTFFDALGLDVVNFSIQDSGLDDYAGSMITERVALPIRVGQNPIRLVEQMNDLKLLDAAEVYAPFDPSKLEYLKN